MNEWEMESTNWNDTQSHGNMSIKRNVPSVPVIRVCPCMGKIFEKWMILLPIYNMYMGESFQTWLILLPTSDEWMYT